MLPFFSLVSESHPDFVGGPLAYYNVLLTVLFVCVGYFGCKRVFLEAFQHLQVRRISTEVCEVLIFSAGAIYFICSFFLSAQSQTLSPSLVSLSGISTGEAFVLISIFIALEKYFHARLQFRLEKQFASLSSPLPENLSEASEVEAATAHVSETIQTLMQEVEVKEKLQSFFNLALIFIAASSMVFWMESGATFIEGLSIVAAILMLALFTRVFPLQPAVKAAALVSLLFKGVLTREALAFEKLDSITNVVVDFLFASPPGQPSVKEITILDDRLDQEPLLSSVLSLLAFSDEMADVAICDFICDKLKNPSLYEVRDVEFYPDMGICGLIEGTEFSFGSEEFLIERGVHIGASEAAYAEEARQSGDLIRYAAIAENIVAQTVLHKSFSIDGKQTIAKLSKMGKRVLLLSKDESSEIDSLGKSLGLELTNIFGGLSQKDYIEKLKKLSPLAFYVNPRTDDKLLKEAEVVISPFNKVTWNLDEGHFTLLRRDARNVLSIFNIHSTLKAFKTISNTSALFLLILLLPLSFLGFLSLTTVGALVLVFSICLSAFGSLVIRTEAAPNKKRRFLVPNWISSLRRAEIGRANPDFT